MSTSSKSRPRPKRKKKKNTEDPPTDHHDRTPLIDHYPGGRQPPTDHDRTPRIWASASCRPSWPTASASRRTRSRHRWPAPAARAACRSTKGPTSPPPSRGRGAADTSSPHRRDRRGGRSRRDRKSDAGLSPAARSALPDAAAAARPAGRSRHRTPCPAGRSCLRTPCPLPGRRRTPCRTPRPLLSDCTPAARLLSPLFSSLHPATSTAECRRSSVRAGCCNSCKCRARRRWRAEHLNFLCLRVVNVS